MRTRSKFAGDLIDSIGFALGLAAALLACGSALVLVARFAQFVFTGG